MKKMGNKSLNYIKNSLSEHFDNYVVIAIDREGNLIWDYNNWMVAVMLIERAKDLIEDSADDIEIVWDDDDDDDDGGSVIKL
jgi:hypothetical protein